MSRLEFWSEDRRFGLTIDDRELLQITGICSRANAKETGGILVGLYTEALNCAMVTAISDAPPDSRIGRHWFDRGVAGLQRWLNKLWFKKRHYYLGEWHLHPNGLPNPSQTDIDQMKAIATSSEYRCPEPILLIVGGSLTSRWKMKAFVFTNGERFIELAKL
jgi:integrative and conjugative element protein (TIGR02256 family)